VPKLQLPIKGGTFLIFKDQKNETRVGRVVYVYMESSGDDMGNSEDYASQDDASHENDSCWSSKMEGRKVKGEDNSKDEEEEEETSSLGCPSGEGVDNVWVPKLQINLFLPIGEVLSATDMVTYTVNAWDTVPELVQTSEEMSCPATHVVDLAFVFPPSYLVNGKADARGIANAFCCRYCATGPECRLESLGKDIHSFPSQWKTCYRLPEVTSCIPSRIWSFISCLQDMIQRSFRGKAREFGTGYCGRVTSYFCYDTFEYLESSFRNKGVKVYSARAIPAYRTIANADGTLSVTSRPLDNILFKFTSHQDLQNLGSVIGYNSLFSIHNKHDHVDKLKYIPAGEYAKEGRPFGITIFFNGTQLTTMVVYNTLHAKSFVDPLLNAKVKCAQVREVLDRIVRRKEEGQSKFTE
jgi:hypothetical protein